MRGEIRYRMIVSASSENNAVFYLTEECLGWENIKPDVEQVRAWFADNGLEVDEFLSYLTMSADAAVVFRLRWC